MAECGQLSKSLLDALASALVKDADGNVSINLETFQANCADVEPFIDCDNNHIPSDAQILNAIGEDDCGRPTLKVTLPLSSDDDAEFSSIRVGTDTDYTHIDETGHITFAGDGRPWRDEVGDALSVQRNGAGITLNLTESTVDFDSNSAYNANPALADFIYKNVQLNHDRDLTAMIYPHIHWFQAKNYSPFFLLQYRWQINGGAKATAWNFLKCNNLAFPYTLGATIHQISYSAAIPVPAGSNLSDVIQFRIYRDNTNASGQFVGTDPYNTGGNASTPVLSFDCHFMIDSIGSSEELSK